MRRKKEVRWWRVGRDNKTCTKEGEKGETIKTLRRESFGGHYLNFWRIEEINIEEGD